MQAINNNSYSSQGIQPNLPYNQANQIHMPKPPVVNPIAQNQPQVPLVQQQMQAQVAQVPQQTQVQQPQQVQTAQIPPQAVPMYPQGVNIPAGGAVNINIFNPMTTNGAPVYPQNTYYTNPAVQYPAYVPQNSAMVPQMPVPQNAYPAVQTQEMNVQMPQPQQLQPQSGQELNQVPQNPTPEQKTEQQPQEKKEEIIPLTDEYIKNLENYLNDNDPKVRLVGTTELLKRFKETETRKSDPALTALLNKTLKDPSASVRQMALTILNVGYATGNDETIAILNNIQSNTSDTMYAEDAIVAKEILLKLSGQAQSTPLNNQAGTVQA